MTALVLLVALTVLVLPGRTPPWPPVPTGVAPAPCRLRRVRGPGRGEGPEPDAELFAAALDGGLPVADATRWAGADLPPGAGDAEAVQWWHRAAPDVGRALAVSDRLGSPAAHLVRAAAQARRDRVALEADLAAGLAGVRATAWLLTGLPLAGAVLAPVLAPSWGADAGRGLVLVAVGAGLLLTGLGWWALRRLVAGARDRALA